jgi:indole-3-glycerol phosphate synthase
MFLEQIMERKKEEVARLKRSVPFRVLEEQARRRTQRHSLRQRLHREGFLFLCEFKRSSPSRGQIAAGKHPLEQAQAYVRGGAGGISVLTESHFFSGSPDDLRQVCRIVSVPVLRKDFLFDPFQIVESAALGADAVLLILRILDRGQARELLQVAREYGLDVLFEIFDAGELDRLPADGDFLLGINNRDLHTFEVNLSRSTAIRPYVPSGIPVISESGIFSPADCVFVKRQGFDGVLVGEALMRAPDPAALLRAMKREVERVDTG